MNAQETSLIIGAMFTGFGSLIWAAGKTYRLIKGTGKSLETNDHIINKKLTEFKDDVNARLNIVEIKIDDFIKRIDWSEKSPDKTRIVMDESIKKMRVLGSEIIDQVRKENATTKEWITSELVRIKGGGNE